MTVLEARLRGDRWSELERMHAEEMGPAHLPPQLVRTFLAQDSGDPEVWQLIAVWRSREALGEYRRSVETPGGVLLFRAVGAEPTLRILEVAQEVAAE